MRTRNKVMRDNNDEVEVEVEVRVMRMLMARTRDDKTLNNQIKGQRMTTATTAKTKNTTGPTRMRDQDEG